MGKAKKASFDSAAQERAGNDVGGQHRWILFEIQNLQDLKYQSNKYFATVLFELSTMYIGVYETMHVLIQLEVNSINIVSRL